MSRRMRRQSPVTKLILAAMLLSILSPLTLCAQALPVAPGTQADPGIPAAPGTSAEPQEPAGPVLDFEPHTQALYLMDRNTGDTLYEYNADQVLSMASTTKIMTYIITAEHVPDLANTRMTIIQEPLKEIEGRGASVCGLDELMGQSVSVLDVLYGLMLPSGCDAGVELAWYVSGNNPSAFIQMMNDKARELGCVNTTFVDAHGLSAGNKTTARELAVIAQYAMTLPHFEEVVTSLDWQIEGAKNPVYTTVNISNPVSGYPYYYRYARGIKTGYTYEAGRCLVSTARRGNADYLCVALNGDIFQGRNAAQMDSASLYSWAFRTYTDTVDVEIDRRFASVQIDGTIQLTGVAADGSTGFTWSSSDESVATVDANGVVTGRGLGETVIKAEHPKGGYDFVYVSSGYYNGFEASNETGDFRSGEKLPFDWSVPKADGMDYVIIRTSWGSDDFPNQTDSSLVNNINGAISQGFPFGFRHISYADSAERAAREAAYFLRVMDETIPDLAPVRTLPVFYDMTDGIFSTMAPDILNQVAQTFAQQLLDRGIDVSIMAESSTLAQMDLETLTGMGAGVSCLDISLRPGRNELKRAGGTTLPDLWVYRLNLSMPGASASDGKARQSLLYMASALGSEHPAPGLTASLSADQKSVHIEWTPTADPACTGYRVYRQAASTGEKVMLLEGDLSTTQFSLDDTVGPGETYTYTAAALFPDPISPDFSGEARTTQMIQTAPEAGTETPDPASPPARSGGGIPPVTVLAIVIVAAAVLILIVRFLIRRNRRPDRRPPSGGTRSGNRSAPGGSGARTSPPGNSGPVSRPPPPKQRPKSPPPEERPRKTIEEPPRKPPAGGKRIAKRR